MINNKTRQCEAVKNNNIIARGMETREVAARRRVMKLGQLSEKDKIADRIR